MLRVLIGTTTDITSRLAGSPDPTATTIASGVTSTSFVVNNASSFNDGDTIYLHQQRRIIDTVVGSTITVTEELDPLPSVGDEVGHYNADYSAYRDAENAFTYTDDLKTGGRTGDAVGNDLVLSDTTGELPAPTVGDRITVYDDVDSSVVLFAGVINRVTRSIIGKHSSDRLAYQYTVEALGYQDEADSLGIIEEPVFNVNAGEYLSYLMGKYTTLEAGEIDTENSPTIGFIRLNTYRRFSDVGAELSQLWPDSEFFIENNHTVGKVYYRQKQTTVAPLTLDEDLLEERGPKAPVEVSVDLSKTYNVVRLPFYKLQRREPDLFVQSTTVDSAFLKTSVTLNGQPTSIDESVLLFDDFLDGDLDSDFVEDDLTNPSPPSGFTTGDGYLVEGEVNSVTGLHLLDPSAASAVMGDIGRVTDPTETQPFTGQERQEIYLQEFVVNTQGDCIAAGIIDQSTYTATVGAGSTTVTIPASSVANFAVGDRLTIEGQKCYIQAIVGTDITLTSALTAPPAEGATITLHRMAQSRVKFGVLFKSSGDLKYIKSGTEYAFGTPRTYTAPETYSLRVFMQCFETTVSGGISSTGVTLTDAANFATGDVVQIFTDGSRSEPETRVITKSGSDITYSSTNSTPKAGYRVRTLPKIVVQIKGGAYGDINERSWTTIHTETNTYQTSATANPDARGVALCLNKSLVGTITLFRHRDPPGITANIGTRYLHIGTQEIESSEPDIDCIVRKVGNHYQLDFFPDTKAFWSSGSTLEVRYDEKFLHHLEDYDRASMVEVAQIRGQSVDDTTSIQELRRLGGRVLDTIDLSPQPMTLREASALARAVLMAVKDVAVVVQINTNTEVHSLVRAGQTILSTLPGVDSIEVKQVQITEVPGARRASGAALFNQKIVAGSVDRISDVLQKRAIKANSRLVIDDGKNDDSYTDIFKTNLEENVKTTDSFSDTECGSPSTTLYDGSAYSLIRCLRLRHGYDSASFSESLTASDSFTSTECTTTTSTLYDGSSYTRLRCLRIA